jgi:hypothetical protein
MDATANEKPCVSFIAVIMSTAASSKKERVLEVIERMLLFSFLD